MSQVMSCEQTLLHNLSCLEEWKGEPRHGEQPLFPPQSPAVVWGWGWCWKELPSHFPLRLAPGWDQRCTIKDALRIPPDTKFEWLNLLTHQPWHHRGMQPLHPSLQQVNFPFDLSAQCWMWVHARAHKVGLSQKSEAHHRDFPPHAACAGAGLWRFPLDL